MSVGSPIGVEPFIRGTGGWLGVIGGKLVQLKKPRHSGGNYFNHKETRSIILMAVVNADFLYAGAGWFVCSFDQPPGIVTLTLAIP